MKTRIIFLSLLIFCGVTPIMAANMCVKNDVVMVVLDPEVSGTKGAINSADKTWSVSFSYGVISGIGGCYSTVLCDTETAGCIANDQSVLSPYNSGGTDKYCYCKMLRPVVSKWVFEAAHGAYANSGGCKDCANYCGQIIALVNGATLRRALFSTAGVP